MAVFAIAAVSDAAKLSASIIVKLPAHDYHKLDDSTWFISAPPTLVTPKEVSDYLGITNGSVGRAIVMPISSYYGYHMKESWDWLIAKGV